MPLPLAAPDRTCLVTGASSGIGVEFARILAKRGYGVTLVARREEPLRQLVNELTTANPSIRAEVVTADLSDQSSRRAIADRVRELGLTVDVLVNNAGFTTTGPVSAADRDREVAMVRTDVEAVVDLCSTYLPEMVQRGTGAVLNVASTAAFQPLPGQAGYAASKAFVLSYTRALNAELHGTGVTATALCPGPVKTGFIEAGGFDAEAAESSLPKVMWLPAADVAQAGIDALDHGRPVVIPGAANKLAAYGGHLTPRRLLLPLVARSHPSLPRRGKS
jgi:short-subunit dehydrogenase